ncbi:type I restriction endonuclease subunit R [Streptomyces roseoverticillatus]|uniref:type I restriction endonuclease subunit R n=1 Tax=Streptomyces roseoverticillatus TaxID=66429 RepID=UPI001F1D950A|nr:type I restriction endonuclease [Streptomyces roseoverticillatus]
MAVERDEVEIPFIKQLQAMKWIHLSGKEAGTLDCDVPFLVNKLDEALRRINRRSEDDEPWMDGNDVSRAIAELASVSRGKPLLEANFDATDLLLNGKNLAGVSQAHGGQSATAQYVEWRPDRLEDNDFTAVNQLRVVNRSGKVSVLDLVLFVNGIPIVVVECKSPDLAEPVYDAVRDLRAYVGDPLDGDERQIDDAQGAPVGVPDLFRTVQLCVAATGESAHLGTVGAAPGHYHPWRSIEPEDESTLRGELRTAELLPRTPDGKPPAKLTEQQKLIGVVLRRSGLLNIVRHYVIPLPVETESGAVRTVKAVCRHQQYRAAEKAVRRLLTGRARSATVPDDERGGVIWHTQGSGKSLTMTFLVRRVHLHPELNQFLVLVVTDRTQLQEQLAKSLKLSESDTVTAETRTQVQGLLRDGGRRVVFAMIQKYGSGSGGGTLTFAGDAERDDDDRSLAEEYETAEKERKKRGKMPPSEPHFPLCNPSPEILVLVDEAHRSHTSTLHAALRKAIPNAAKIGFTGTPIIRGQESDTLRIFGSPGGKFLDSYRMEEAEHDGVVVRIRYEGRTGEGAVQDRNGLDRTFEDLVRHRTDEERDQLLKQYPTDRDVAESVPMIQAKADDMLEHWVTTVLPGGFKAQIAAVSRKAAVEYRAALGRARDQLLDELREFDPESVVGIPPEELPRRLRVLHEAYRYRALLRRVDFVPVISGGKEQKERRWLSWTDKDRQSGYIDRFHHSFPQYPAESEWAAAVPVSVSSEEPAGGAHGAANPWSDGDIREPDKAEGRPGIPDPVDPESPIAFLIVKSMLLTGFDAPREQVLYLDRPIRDAELLQAVARVNRPASGKEVGYVVDYYGVFEHLSSALADYRQADITDTMRPMSEETKRLAPAADAVRAFLHQHGIDDSDLDDVVRLRGAVLSFEEEATRFDFDEVLHEFTAILERVLPHEDALEYVPAARRWALLQKRIRRLHRDASGGDFSMRRYGKKVRELIAEHLEGPEIEQAIPPVSLTSPSFDGAVRHLPPREAAAEMGHALRFHLEEQVKRDDPAKYARLSERLEDILRRIPGRFEEQIEALGPLIAEARQEEDDDPAMAGLTPLEQRVHRLLEQLLKENPGVRREESCEMRDLTRDFCDLAGSRMAKASYQGRSQDLTALAHGIQTGLMRRGLKPDGADFGPLKNMTQRLAAYAQEHRLQFLRRVQGQ